MKWQNILPPLILLLFIYVILSIVDTKRLLELFLKADIFYLAAAFIFSVTSLLLFTLSWRLLFYAIYEKISFRDLFATFIIGIFSSAINPVGRVGSEGVKLILLNRKDGITLAKSTSSVILKNMFGFLVMAILILLFLLLIFLSGGESALANYALWGIFFMIVGMATCLLSLTEKGGRLLLSISSPILKAAGKSWKKMRSVEEWSSSFLLKLQSSFVEAKRNPSFIYMSNFVCLLGWIFLYATAGAVFYSLGLRLPVLVLCLCVTLSEIASLLPLPAGTSGTDIALTLLFNVAGLPIESSFAGALLTRFLAFYVPVIAGGIFSIFYSFHSVTKTL